MINTGKRNFNALKYNKYLLWFIICVIFMLAVLPAKKMPEAGFNDKVNHVIAFFVLSIFALFAYPGVYLRSGLWLMLYGILIEIVQIWIPGRNCSLPDLVADLCGILTGMVVVLLFRRTYKSDI